VESAKKVMKKDDRLIISVSNEKGGCEDEGDPGEILSGKYGYFPSSV
jgi:hypothetical protein